MQQKTTFFVVIQIYLYLCGENMQEIHTLDGQ